MSFLLVSLLANKNVHLILRILSYKSGKSTLLLSTAFTSKFKKLLLSDHMLQSVNESNVTVLIKPVYYR